MFEFVIIMDEQRTKDTRSNRATDCQQLRFCCNVMESEIITRCASEGWPFSKLASELETWLRDWVFSVAMRFRRRSLAYATGYDVLNKHIML